MRDFLEVDNCELWGWSHAAIYAKSSKDHRIHHNYIHLNRRTGLGYGVVLDAAEVLIDSNRFDQNRHHIAGTGKPGTSYEASYNLVLNPAGSHHFDMHGGRDRGDGTNIAGDVISIHHNTFAVARFAAFLLRGIPQAGAKVYLNKFAHSRQAEAVRQINATGNLSVFTNTYNYKQ